MATFNKPEFNSVWATSGAKVAPDAAKISLGWVVEIPPHEIDNWIRNRQDAMLAHINQAGVVYWDETVEYQANKSYVQGRTTGNVYRAITTHTGVNPETDVNNNWQVAFEAGGSALLKAENLADVPDKALARQNLGISTTSDYDGRYLQRSQNLADVPNKSTGRANLDVYSKQEVIDLINNMQPAGEVAPFARSTAPDGWLVCDGQAVSRTTYARLFAAIGTTFGAGNGSSTFNVPDLRGEFIRGWDNWRGVDPGRVFGRPQGDAMRVLQGTILFTEMIGGTPCTGVFKETRTWVPRTYRVSGEGYTTTVTLNTSDQVPTASEFRPRNVALLYCIKT